MKHTPIKQTLTTLSLLSTLTLSDQVIDRFPHVESFESTVQNSSWTPICPSQETCTTDERRLVFSLLNSNFMSGKDGDQFVRSSSVSNNSPQYVITSPVYDLSCATDASISFLYTCDQNSGLDLELSLDGGLTWEQDEIWENPKITSPVSLTSGEADLSDYIGKENVSLRFTTRRTAALDKIKVGPSGNTINLSYNYDLAGNRIGSELIIMLQEDETIVNRESKSEDNSQISDFEFNLYPNPTNSYVNIRSDFAETVHLEVYNGVGVKMDGRYFLMDHRLDVSSFDNGMYFVHIFNEDRTNKVVYTIVKASK